MYIKDYLTRPKNKAKDKKIQNSRLLRIISRTVSKTYNK